MSDADETQREATPEALPEELAPLVEAMRADVLGPAAVVDVARRVEAVTRTLPHAPGPTGAALTGAKLLGLGALAVLGGAALIVTAIHGVGGDAPASRAVMSSGALRDDANTPPAHETPATPARSAPGARATVSPSAAPATASEITAPAANTQAEPTHEEARESADSANAAPAPRPAHARDEAPHAAARPHAPRPDPSASADAEHVLLVEARRTLPGDPARALALADQHAARFAAGMLAPEREMIAVDALEALGRREAAARRAAALVARWPGSSYARRVQARGLVP